MALGLTTGASLRTASRYPAEAMWRSPALPPEGAPGRLAPDVRRSGPGCPPARYHTCPSRLSHMALAPYHTCLNALSHMPCASLSDATDGSRRNPSATATTGGVRPLGAFPTDSAAFRQIPGAFAESPRKESAPLDSVPPVPIPLITHALRAYHTCLRAYHTCLSAYHTCLGGPAPNVRQVGRAAEWSAAGGNWGASGAGPPSPRRGLTAASLPGGPTGRGRGGRGFRAGCGGRRRSAPPSSRRGRPRPHWRARPGR